MRPKRSSGGIFIFCFHKNSQDYFWQFLHNFVMCTCYNHNFTNASNFIKFIKILSKRAIIQRYKHHWCYMMKEHVSLLLQRTYQLVAVLSDRTTFSKEFITRGIRSGFSCVPRPLSRFFYLSPNWDRSSPLLIGDLFTANELQWTEQTAQLFSHGADR